MASKQHTRQWIGFRVFIGCVMGMAALAISATGEASSLASTRALLPAFMQQDPDLCAMLQRAAGTEPVRLTPGVGQPGAITSCIMDYPESDNSPKFGSIIVSNRGNPGVARKAVEDGSKLENWGVKFFVPTGSYGDPGYGFEQPEMPDPDPDPRVNGKPLAAGLLFARGCFVASGYAGAKGQAQNPATMRAILTTVDQALQQPPFSLCGAATPDLTLDHIEVVQVVQDELNRVQLYSGKETLVRVFIRADGATSPVAGVEVELRAFPAGNDAGVVIAARNTPFLAPLSPSRGALTDTVNFDLPADLITSSTYPVKVTVNPNRTIAESNYDNNGLTRQVTFVEPQLLRVGYVRIGYTPPGSTNVVWPAGPLQTYTSTLVNIYPTNGSLLQYYELPNRLVYPGPLTGIENKVALRDWLRRRYDRLRSRRGEMAPDLVIGYLAWIGPGAGAIPNPAHVFTDAVGLAEMGTYDGEARGMPPPAPAETRSNFVGRTAWVVDYNGNGGVDSSERVLAHEVGHMLTLHHPATDDRPTCWGPSVNDFPGYWQSGTGTTGQVGYNRLTRGLVPDLFYDVLNYCPANRTWISPLHYKRLFDAMGRYNLNDPDLKPDLAWDDFLVSGSLARDGSSGSLDPLYRVTGSAGSENAPYLVSSTGEGLYSPPVAALASSGPPPQQGKGDNCLRFTGANGAISEHCFDVSFYDEETGRQLDNTRFSLRVPYPQGVTGVELARKGNALDRRSASSNAPVLGITSPKSGDSWDGSQTISWSASDPDGDALTYEVHYSPNGGNDWFPLELDLQETQYRVNTADIAGGDNVLLRVLASDGFNTSQADVGPIKVPNSPPFEPPALPGANPPKSQPAQPVSGSNALLMTLLSLGLALFGVAVLAGTFVMTRRSRAWQGPTGYPPASVPPHAQQGPRIPPLPPVPPMRPAAGGPPPMPGTHSAAGVRAMPGNPFAGAQKEYERLRGELTAGRMSAQQFEAVVRQVRVKDAQGRTWMLASNTGEWLVYDGRTWVPGKPL